MTDQSPADAGILGNIRRFVVLMLENRSFDHVLGALKTQNPAIAGALDGEFSNPADPALPGAPAVATGPVKIFSMPFDPGHDFADVQIQLYGRASGAGRIAAPRKDPAPMSGFVVSAAGAADQPSNAALVMQGYRPEQLRVLSTLAAEFAVINYWHAPLPGPTWPNRFFAHAATSGGLSDSPREVDILAGFSFPAGTIYQRLAAGGRSWRIYHEGLPQSAGIDSLRPEFLNIFTENFREMSFFEADLGGGAFPDYVFIEPHYDTGNRFLNGNSMHPLNDVRKGELLVKRVYEALRASPFWAETMLIVTFDEHGGFFDHVPPPPAVAPGGDARYANPANHFDFDRLGVRVPAVVVSAHTQKGTVLGKSPLETYDHTSILATVEKRFGLAALTRRDAEARTLEGVLNLRTARQSDAEAPLTLPQPAPEGLVSRLAAWFRGPAVHPEAPLSTTQKVQLALAHACNLQVADPESLPQMEVRYRGISRQREAADYVGEVEQRIRSRRRSQPLSGSLDPQP